jgi:GT2 family glycosyltransferase
MNDRFPMVSIVITTRNRKIDLVRALQSCFTQAYPNLEVLVFDDGSTDGSAQIVAEQFPSARIIRDENRKGYIVRRNQGFAQARGKYVVSLDDDAYFTDPCTMEPVVAMFESADDLAAIAMTFVEPPISFGVDKQTGTEVRSYIGCAHAIRREAALQLQYREILIHQGEERDLCIRLMDQGWRIAQCPTPPIVHRPSPVRNRQRIERFGIRNTLLFDTLNIPMPYLVMQFLRDCAKLVCRKPGWPITLYRAWYLLEAVGSCVRFAHLRHPVSRVTYRRFARLPRHGPIPYARHLSDSSTEACSSISSSSLSC